MAQLKAEWQKVFKYAAAVAKDSCKKNASLTYPQAMKKAWKDPRVMVKRREYEKKKAAAKLKIKKTTISKTKVATVRKSSTRPVTKKIVRKVVKK